MRPRASYRGPGRHRLAVATITTIALVAAWIPLTAAEATQAGAAASAAPNADVNGPQPPPQQKPLDPSAPASATQATTPAPASNPNAVGLPGGGDATPADSPPVAVAGEVPSGSPKPVLAPEAQPSPVQIPPGRQVPATEAPTKTGKPLKPGFDPWTSTENVGKRTADTAVFDNPDGSHTADVAQGPQFFKSDLTGNFERIDTTLTRGLPGTTTPGWRNASGAFQTTFSDGTAGPLATITYPGGRTLAWDIVGAASRTPTIKQDTATYHDVLPGVDLLLQVTTHGVKESLVFADATAAAQPIRYAYQLDGLRFTAAADGSIDVVASGARPDGTKDGDKIGSLPKGSMVDAGPSMPGVAKPEGIDLGARSNGVTYALTQATSGQPSIMMTLDQAWLADPARAWPVTVDPTTTTNSSFGPNDDSYVVSTATQLNSGSTQWDTGPLNYLGYLYGLAFTQNTSFVAFWAHAHILSATFNAYQWSGGTCGIPRPVDVYRIKSPWVGPYIQSWPGPDTDFSTVQAETNDVGTGACAKWLQWNITNLVDQWVHSDTSGYNGWPNYGLVVYPNSAYVSDWNYSWRVFDSGDSIAPPQFQLTWNDYNATYTPTGTLKLPALGTTGSEQVTVRNLSRFTWPAGGTVRLSNHVYRVSDGAQIVWDGPRTYMPSDVGYGQSVTLNASIPALAPGTYALYWDMVNEGDQWFSAQSVPMYAQTITVPAIPPVVDSANVSSGTTLTPTLSVTAHDPDNYTGTINYTFQICTGGDAKSGSCATSPTSTATSWQVPANFLSWDTSYYWNVTMNDGSAAPVSGFVVPGRLTPVPPQPSDANLGVAQSAVYIHDVSPYNLNLLLAYTDASTTGDGPHPVVARTYNSADTRSAASLPFGGGWNFEYGMSVSTQTNGDVRVRLADGRLVEFGANPDGTFGAPPALPATLTGTQAGGYTMVDGATGTQYAFGANDGPLTSITDRDGRVENLSYTSGKLATVTSQVDGRSLSFSWTGAHITSVSTANIAANGNQPYTWTYSYTGDQLTKVCSPKSSVKCWVYGYTTVGTASLLSSVTMPKGNTSDATTYNGDGTVATRKDAYNNTWSFASTTVNGAKRTTVTGPDNATASVVYDTNGRVVTNVDESGQTRRYTYNDLGYQASSVDPNGHVTRFAYDAHGNPLRTITPRSTGTGFGAYMSGLTPAPVGWWRLGEVASTTAADSSPNKHSGSYVGSPNQGGAGGLGTDPSGAVVLNGSSQYVDVPAGTWANLTGDATVSGWIRPDAPSQNATIVSKRDTTGTGTFQLRIQNGSTVDAWFGDSDNTLYDDYQAPYTFSPGRWYEVTATRAGSTVTIYVNGVALTTVAQGTGALPAWSGDLTIGAANASTPTNYFTGAIQDVAFWTSALAPNTIAGAYAAGQNISYRDLLPTSGTPPYAWYRFGEASGTTAADSSGHGLNATYVGGPSLGQTGAILGDSSTAASFNGTSQYVQLPSGMADFSSGFTLEAWVNPVSVNGYERIFDLGNGANADSVVFSRYNGTTSALLYTCNGPSGSNCAWIVVPNAMPAGQWSHLVATVDQAGNAAVYRNGVLMGTGAVPLPRNINRSSNFIGKSNWTGDVLFHGTIDDVALYQRALTPGEVASHFTAGSFPSANQAVTATTYHDYYRTPYQPTITADAPAGYWRLGEQSGSTAADSSGNGHSGTIDASVQRSPVGAVVNDSNGSMATTGGGPAAGPINGTGIATPTSGFTLESWVNVPDSSRKGAFITTGPASSAAVSVGVGNGTLDTPGNHLIGVYDYACWIDSGVNIGVGWHHVAMRVNVNNSADFFLDGTKVASLAACAPIAGRGNTWSVGGYVVSTLDRRTNGVGYEDAAIYTSTLTDAQLRNHYLVGVWRNSDPRNNKVTTTRDPRSAGPNDNTYTTTYSYDASGRTTGVTSPATADFPTGRTASTAYTVGTEAAYGGTGTMPSGLVRTQTDARGKVTTYSYDSKGDLRQTVDPVGLTTTYTYDELGRPLTTTTNPGGTTTTTYDALMRPLTVTEPSQANVVTNVTHTKRTTNSYDDNENLTSAAVSDTTGGDATRTTSYTYDDNDRQITSTDPANHTTQTGYDAYGRVHLVTDASNSVTQIDYTPAGLEQKVTLKNFVDDPFANGGTGTTPRDVVLEQRSYDPAGRLAQSTDALGHVTTYTYTDDGLAATTTLKGFHVAGGGTADVTLDSKVYDLAGNVTSESTANGTRTTTTLYDAAGRVALSTLDPSGLNRSRSYVYDANNDVTSTTLSAPDGTSQTQTMTYDDASRQLSATLGSLTQSVTRDARGLVATSTDAAGKTTTNSYDALGELYRVVSPTVSVESNGGAPANQTPTTDTGYDTFGEATHAKDPNGYVTVTAFNPTGTTASVTQPPYTPPGGTVINASVSYSYDSLNRVHTTTDALGKVTTTDYDMRSRPIRTTGPAITGVGTQVSRTFYDDLGHVVQSNDPTGAQTTSTYDDLGRVATTTLAERVPSAQNLTTTYGYDWAGNQTSQTDPANIVTSSTYDAADQELTSTDGRSHTTTNTYDGIGRLTRTTDPLSRSVRNSNFTALGKPQTVTHNAPDGTTLTSQTIGYDNVGRVTSSTDPNGHAMTYTFDALGHETQMAEPADAFHTLTTTFGYDAAGNQTRITDPNGNATILTYNSWEQPESRIEPSTPTYPNASDRTWTAKYDANGRQTELDGPGGVVQTTAYNEAGWITGVNGSGGGAAAASKTFGYDLNGRVTTASHPSSTMNFSYNDRGEVVSTSGGAGSGTYAYDADGRMTSRTDPGGQSTTYTYDNAGNVVTASGFAGGPTQNFTYDNANQLTHTDYGSGNISRDYTYDNLGRLSTDTVKSGGGATLASLVYGYDNNSNVTAENTTGLSGAGTNTFSYDWANRLTSWVNPSSTVSNYTWDGNSNRLTSGTTSATYDARNRLQSTSSSNSVSDIHLTGAASNTISTPDSAALSSTGDLDVRVKVAMDDWTPTNGAEVADKVRETGNQRSWDWWIEPNGTPMIMWSADGTNQLFAHLLTPTGFTDGSTHWIRFTLKANNGSGGNDVKFYTSTDGTTWTQLGATLTQTGTTSVYDSTAPVELGAYNGVGNAAAKFFAAQVYSGINGTQVANWQASTLNPSSPSPSTDSAGNVWTINGTGWTTDLSGSPVTTTYSYTPRGTESSKTVGTTTTNATFNALDQMTGFGTTSYTYDALGRTASAGSTTFQYAGTEMEPSTVGSWTYYRNSDGSLRGAKNGTNAATALVANQHGDVVASLASNATSLATSTTYDPWGQVASTAGTNVPSVGYQGQYTDPTSNNVDAEARWYDPSTGNFLNRDATNLPATTSANINRDAYANANPIGVADPTGQNGIAAAGEDALEACARMAAACIAAGSAAAALGEVGLVVGGLVAFGYVMHKVFGGGDMMQEMREKIARQLQEAARNTLRSTSYARTMTGAGSYASYVDAGYVSECWFCTTTYVGPGDGTISSTGSGNVGGGRHGTVLGHHVIAHVVVPVIPLASIPHSPPPPNPAPPSQADDIRSKLGTDVTDGAPAINAAATYLYGPQVGTDVASTPSMGNGPCGTPETARAALEASLAYNPARRNGAQSSANSGLAAANSLATSCSHYDPGRRIEQELTSGDASGRGSTAPDAAQPDGGTGAPRTLFHYTDEAGFKGITQSGELNPSLVGGGDAHFGPGQYLTDITPEQVLEGPKSALSSEQLENGYMSRWQLSNRLFQTPWKAPQLTHFIEIDVAGLEVVNPRSGTFVVPGEEPLDVTKRIVSGGKF